MPTLPLDRIALYERLKALPPHLSADLERRENELIRRGADADQLEGIQRLYLKQLELWEACQN